MNAGDLHSLARLLRAIALAAATDPGEKPVRPGDLAVIEDVAHHDQASIGEIAERTGLAQSLVSKTVAALLHSGILRKAPDPADGRRALISLDPVTKAGLFRSRSARSVETAIRQCRPDISDADLLQVVELLDALASRLLA